MKQVVILAGGKGTRLRERLGDLPKPLIDICGIPLLERQILLAKKHGFSKVLILVNHAAEHIVDFCASKLNWGLAVECIDDGDPRGTAGATLAVFDKLQDEFLVMYGDTMLQVDLTRFHDYHAATPGVSATLFLHPNDHPHDSDLVSIGNDGRINAFHPYPHDSFRFFPNLVNAALYWINKKALLPWKNEQRTLDFAKDLFPAMLTRGLTLRGYNSPEYIKDIGTPARLDKVCADFRSGRIERSSLDQPQSLVFIDRDGTINREVDHLSHPDEFELLPGVEKAIKHLNQSDYRCCVVTNQPVIARGECEVETLHEIHNKMETLLGRFGAYIDRIYYCPHHPDKGFPGERADLKVDCDCRKPKTGMIKIAAREFNMAGDHSWLIGDSSVDIETARRAGLKSILVETGYAGLDYRTWAIADAIVPDLYAAVTHIIDHYPRLLAHCTTLAAGIREGAIILVGGHSRSGKSTFANILRDALIAKGMRAWILGTDRWLRNDQDRAPGVLGRYDMNSLQNLVNILAAPAQRPKILALPGYHKLKRKQMKAVESVEVTKSDVILIEGVVALGLDTPDTIQSPRFFVEIDESSRKQRVIKEYQLRGLTHAEALEIYLARMQDEFPEVERLSCAAQRTSLSSEWMRTQSHNSE